MWQMIYVGKQSVRKKRIHCAPLAKSVVIKFEFVECAANILCILYTYTHTHTYR